MKSLSDLRKDYSRADLDEAALLSARAGNDMIMTTPSFFEGALDAVAEGILADDAFDAAAARILTLKFELGLFENPRLPGTELDAVVAYLQSLGIHVK